MRSILFKIVRTWQYWFKCNYVKDRKLFLKFFFYFLTLHQKLKILKRNVIVTANVFPKLQHVKILVKSPSKELCFRTYFENQQVKVSEILVKSAWEHFYLFFSSLWGELILKTSRLLICEILGVFIKTLRADEKYSVRHFENFSLPIQMQLS